MLISGCFSPVGCVFSNNSSKRNIPGPPRCLPLSNRESFTGSGAGEAYIEAKSTAAPKTTQSVRSVHLAPAERRLSHAVVRKRKPPRYKNIGFKSCINTPTRRKKRQGGLEESIPLCLAAADRPLPGRSPTSAVAVVGILSAVVFRMYLTSASRAG